MRVVRFGWLAVMLCGASAPAQESVALTIVWVQGPPADALAHMGKLYEAATGVRVVVEQVPWTEYGQRVEAALSQKSNRFDIVVGDYRWLGRASSRGYYLDLSEWIRSGGLPLDQLPPVVRSVCAYPTGGERYYAVPCQTDALGFCYRKDLFEDGAERSAFMARYGRELAVPQTWEELRQVAEFFARPQKRLYGCALLTGPIEGRLTRSFQPLMDAFGGALHDAQLHVKGHLNSPESVAALELFRSLVRFAPRAGGSAADNPTAVAAFNEGRLAMLMGGFSTYPALLEGPLADRVGFFPLPGQRLEDGTIRRPAGLVAQEMSVVSYVDEARRQRAMAFLRWFHEEAQQRKWAELGGLTVHAKVLADEGFLDARPFNRAFAESLPRLRPFWTVPEYDRLLAELERGLARYVESRSATPTAQETLDAIAEAQERILREAGHLQ